MQDYDSSQNGTALKNAELATTPEVGHSTLNSQPAFRRHPGETPRAFSAFMTYFQLGHARSLQAVADKLDENSGTVRNWSSRHDWAERLQACNSGLLQEQVRAQAALHLQQPIGESMKMRMHFDPPYSWRVSRLFAGGDLFSRQFDGSTLAAHFSDLGITLHPANTNRVQGWAEILTRLGDPDAGIKPTLFIHKRCARLLDCLPFLQHDPDHPADVLKTNPNEEGLGGDDAADALRYLVATRVPTLHVAKLRGL